MDNNDFDINKYEKYLTDEEGNISFSKKKETSMTANKKIANQKIAEDNKKPEDKRLKRGLVVLCGITGVLEAICLVLLAILNVLPIGLYILVMLAFILLLVIICTLMFMKSKHRFGKRKIVATVLSIITIISCIIGIFMMGKLMGTLDSVLKGKDISKDKLDDPFVIYLSGSDTRNNELSNDGRSDVNILAVVNPVTYQMLLINTPRDYYVQNPNCNNGMDKLTHCGLGGVESSMKALNQLYDIDVIDYYCRINFTGFETLVDSIGGIDIYSDTSFSTVSTDEYGSIRISSGNNHLNGIEALAYARERHALASGDLARGENQMKVIKAIISKITSSDTLIRNYSDIMNSMSGMFETDTPKLLLQNAVKKQLADSPNWNIKSYSVTGNVSTAVCASSGEALSVVYQDKESVAQAKELIEQVFAGEILQ